MHLPLIKLTVRKTNTRAIRLYEFLGYKFVHTIAKYYNDGEDGLLMEKRTEIRD
jgi:ribosomal protein S18 acetylase RimI-like enzyme